MRKPVVVLSSNDGCIVARSAEVKAAGIPMGVPHFKIKKELEELGVHVFSSNFPLYRDVSFRVMEILSREVSGVEQYSVDEAFFRLPDMPREQLEVTARHVKDVVEREVGVPVTVGLARTKTIAKCATERGKKDGGVLLLHGEVWKTVRKEFPLADVWGIGSKTAAKMRAQGLYSVEDLLAADPSRIRALFGVAGVRLRYELNEQSTHTFHAEDEIQQSIMSTRSFAHTTTDRAVVSNALAYHVAHAAEELRALRACAQGLRVMVRPSRHGDWALRGGVREALLVAPTDDTRVLLREAIALLDRLYEAGVPYKKTGVVLTHMQPRTSVAPSLFGAVDDSSSVLKIMDQLNSRFGSGTLTIGRTRSIDAWAASRAHISPRYTTDWNELPLVVA